MLRRISYLYRHLGDCTRLCGNVLWARGVKRKTVLLIRRSFNMGDVICTFPAVIALHHKFPGSMVVYETASPFTEVVEAARVSHLTISSSRPLKRLSDLVLNTFSVVFSPTYSDERGDTEPRHIVDEYASELGVELEDPQPRLFVRPSWGTAAVNSMRSRRGLERKLLILLHTGPTWGVRTWPKSHWDQLVVMLGKMIDCEIAQIGTERVVPNTGMVDIRVDGVLDYVGKFTLGESIAAIASADLLIGVDSGLLHIAGAVNTPSVGIFGPTKARFRLPLITPSAAAETKIECGGCHHHRPVGHQISTCPKSVACMVSVTPFDVLNAAVGLLNRIKLGTAPGDPASSREAV